MVDRLGAWAGGLCAVHCILVALLVGFLPGAASAFHISEWVEWSLILFAAFAGGWTAWRGYQHRAKVWPVILLIAGIGLLICGHLMGPGLAHQVASPLGGVLLVVFQLNNRRCDHSCTCR